MASETSKPRKTLEQLAHQIAHETDDDNLSLLISELHMILQAEQQEIREHIHTRFSLDKSA